jgi:nucleoid DNA-binding protein
MKLEEIARKLAKQAHIPAAEARDQVDALVHKILKSLREGKPVEFPGIGRLVTSQLTRAQRTGACALRPVKRTHK